MCPIAARAKLTPKSDTQGVTVKLKVYWKHVNRWNDSYIKQYRQFVPRHSDYLITNYSELRKDGRIYRGMKHTCEDLAIRILVDFAFDQKLPIALTCGAGVFRNMEMYDPSDDTPPNTFGYMQKSMRSIAAQDILNDKNTRSIQNDLVKAGDMLVQLEQEGQARHVQVVIQNTGNEIQVIQGNQKYEHLYRASYAALKLTTGNKSYSVADPTAAGYEGVSPGKATFTRNSTRWNYRNRTTGFFANNFLSQFVGREWHFQNFNY